MGDKEHLAIYLAACKHGTRARRECRDDLDTPTQSNSEPHSNLQPQNIDSGYPDKPNSAYRENTPAWVALAGTAQNPNQQSPGLHHSATGRIEASPAIKQELPVAVATIANQPVIVNPIGQGYHVGSTVMMWLSLFTSASIVAQVKTVVLFTLSATHFRAGISAVCFTS